MKNKNNKETLPSKEDFTKEFLNELREEGKYLLGKRKHFRNEMAQISKKINAVDYKKFIGTDTKDDRNFSEALKLADDMISTCQEMIGICDTELERVIKRVKDIERQSGINRKSVWEEQNDWFIAHKEEIQKKEKEGIPWDFQYFEYLASKEKESNLKT